MSASFVHILGSEVPISPSVHSSPYSLEAVDLGELLPGSSALPSQYLSSWRPLTPLAKVGFKLILVPCLPLQGTERPCLPAVLLIDFLCCLELLLGVSLCHLVPQVDRVSLFLDVLGALVSDEDDNGVDVHVV